MDDNFYLTLNYEPSTGERQRQPLRKKSSQGMERDKDKDELLKLAAGKAKDVIKGDLDLDLNLDEIIELDSQDKKQEKKQDKKQEKVITNPPPLPSLDISVPGGRKNTMVKLGDRQSKGIQPEFSLLQQGKNEYRDNGFLSASDLRKQTLYQPAPAVGADRSLEKLQAHYEGLLARMQQERERTEREQREANQRMLKEERERHKAQLERLGRVLQAQADSKSRLLEKQLEMAKSRYEQLLRSQRQIFQNEIRVLQGQLKETKGQSKTDSEYAQVAKAAVGMQELQFAKKRLQDDKQRVKEDKEQVRLERQQLVNRELAISKKLEEERAQMAKELDRVCQGERRIYLQLLQLEEQRKKVSHERERARDELRRESERAREQTSLKGKELQYERDILKRERASFEQERREFDLTRAKILEQTDAMRRNLMIREADYNSKLRAIEQKEAQATRAATQLQDKLAVLDLEKDRYQSEMRRIQLLNGQTAQSLGSTRPQFRQKQNLAERISSIDNYLRATVQQPVTAPLQAKEMFRRAAGVEEQPQPRGQRQVRKEHSGDLKRRSQKVSNYIKRLTSAKSAQREEPVRARRGQDQFLLIDQFLRKEEA